MNEFASAASGTPGDAAACARVAPPTLLCVDDEPNILASLRRLFRASGYRVLTAESGAQGLAILEQEPVDVVISDMRMPEMDGARFLGLVRAKWPATLRMLLTGYSDIQSIQEAINRGEIYRYITKPWEDQDLLLLVRHAIERSALETEKKRLEALTLRQNDELRMLNQSLEAKVEARTRLLKVEHEATVAANNKLKHNFVTTIKIFSSMIELRAHSLPGHARLVADMARRIAVNMALDAKETQDVFIAALLHDIGKVGFSDLLLTTPLTLLHGESLGQFRKHPQHAEQLLMPLEELQGSAVIIRHHLERFDGNGFPDGIAGLEIPLGARILAVAADYYNLQHGAMVQRHLRADEARSLITSASGKRYDPHVVAAFRQIVDSGKTDPGGVQVLARELRAGMKLARDLISSDGLMLLAVDRVLDAKMIDQICSFETKSNDQLTIWVRGLNEEPS
jgi:response regulator RpfG family c-di-GMP phosphodiesterase